MELFDSPRRKELLGTLESGEALDQAQIRLRRREQQLIGLRNRAGEIKARCAEIAERLPDANRKEVGQLQAERRDLLAELQALPADLTVTSRLFAEALADFNAIAQQVIDVERKALRHQLEASDKPYREAEYHVKNGTALDPRYQANHERYIQLAEQRRPALDRLDDLRELSESLATYVRHALHSEAADLRPGGVKLDRDHRPQPEYITRFVEEAARHAA